MRLFLFKDVYYRGFCSHKTNLYQFWPWCAINFFFFERRWRDELWSGVESRWIRRFVATATIYSLGRFWSKTCLYSFRTNYVFLMTRLWIITPFVYLLISLMGRTTLTHVLQPLYSYNAVLTPLNASTANYTSNTTCNGWTDYPLGQIRCPNVIDRPTDRYYCKFPSTMYLCHGYPKRRQL